MKHKLWEQVSIGISMHVFSKFENHVYKQVRWGINRR